MFHQIVQARAVVLLCVFGLLGIGLWSDAHLPIDAVPDITGVQVQINTEPPLVRGVGSSTVETVKSCDAAAVWRENSELVNEH